MLLVLMLHPDIQTLLRGPRWKYCTPKVGVPWTQQPQRCQSDRAVPKKSTHGILQSKTHGARSSKCSSPCHFSTWRICSLPSPVIPPLVWDSKWRWDSKWCQAVWNIRPTALSVWARLVFTIIAFDFFRTSCLMLFTGHLLQKFAMFGKRICATYRHNKLVSIHVS